MSGRTKDFIALIFLGLLLVLAYFLIIAPGKSDTTIYNKEQSGGRGVTDGPGGERNFNL